MQTSFLDDPKFSIPMRYRKNGKPYKNDVRLLNCLNTIDFDELDQIVESCSMQKSYPQELSSK